MVLGRGFDLIRLETYIYLFAGFRALVGYIQVHIYTRLTDVGSETFGVRIQGEGEGWRNFKPFSSALLPT